MINPISIAGLIVVIASVYALYQIKKIPMINEVWLKKNEVKIFNTQ